MKSGKMRNRFTIEVNTPVQDDETGEITDGYAESGKLWGTLEESNSRDIQQKSGDTIIVTHTIKCRKNATIRANPKTSRLIMGDRTFVISSVLFDDAKQEMKIEVAEQL